MLWKKPTDCVGLSVTEGDPTLMSSLPIESSICLSVIYAPGSFPPLTHSHLFSATFFQVSPDLNVTI